MTLVNEIQVVHWNFCLVEMGYRRFRAIVFVKKQVKFSTDLQVF